MTSGTVAVGGLGFVASRKGPESGTHLDSLGRTAYTPSAAGSTNITAAPPAVATDCRLSLLWSRILGISRRLLLGITREA